ncbi:MAG: AraC family transcriptional regulator [Ruminococcaceae bacterium]|nr:AraC family transcriptional regulator [Oscillospiraceae bacterium]
MTVFPKLNFLRVCFEDHNLVMPLESNIIPYIDITFCIKGEMHYIFEGESVVLHDGDAILYPQGSVRERLESREAALYCSFNVSVPDDFVPEVKGFLPKSVRSDTVLMLHSAKKSFDSVSYQKNEKCTSIFWYLYYQLVESAENNEHPHIKNIKHYIAKHLTEPMTLKEISEAVHLVPHYCCALFSRHTGMTLFDFISLQRTEYAKSLILTTDMSLTEIAQQSGFCDYNYFSRVFKKKVGIAPSKYKKAGV